MQANNQIEPKKYYWMKLFDTFFQDPKIKKLKKLAGGDTYIVITLKVMLLTIKTNGIYQFEQIERTLADELALKIDEETLHIQVVLDYLASVNLIEEINKTTYKLPQVEKMIGSETRNAERVRKHREIVAKKQKALHCNTTETKCNTEIEIEIEHTLKSVCSISSIKSKYIGKDFKYLVIKNLEEIEENKIVLTYFDKKDLESKKLKFFSCEQLEQKLKIFENGGYYDGDKIRSC